MNTLEDFILSAHAKARGFKEHLFRETGRPSMPFITTGFRGHAPCIMFLPDNRDRMLFAARLAMVGFDCDRVATTVDTFAVTTVMSEQTKRRIATGKLDGREVYKAIRQVEEGQNPDTGQPWRQGDMQRAFEAGRPWVKEMLTTSALDKVEQRIVDLWTGYRTKQRSIIWETEEFSDGVVREHGVDGWQSVGLVPDTFRDILSQPGVAFEVEETFRDLGILDELGWDPAERRWHTDAVLLRVAATQGLSPCYELSDAKGRELVAENLANEHFNALFAKMIGDTDAGEYHMIAADVGAAFPDAGEG